MSVIQQQLRSLVKNTYGEHCPLQMPWFVDRHAESAIHRMRRAALDYEWTLARTAVGRAKLFLAALLWPGVSLVKAIAKTHQCGRFVRQNYGVSVFEQFYQQLYLTNVLNLPGDIYYRYRLFQRGVSADISYYLSGYAFRLLHKKIDRYHRVEALDDKALFYQNCQARKLPVVPTIAIFRQGSVELPVELPAELPAELSVAIASKSAFELPLQSLFLKPVNELCGNGAECWQYNADAALWQRKDQTLTQQQLVAHCRERSHTRPYLLQPCIRSHAQLQPLSPGALPTVRVVTTRRIGQAPTLVRAALRMAMTSQEIDNFSKGGIAAAIDTDSGQVGTAVAKDFTQGSFERHPVTHAQIKDTVLPYWSDVRRLVIKAHEKFSEFVSIGWDIAITNEGPLLLEANVEWGYDLVQIPHAKPLGDTDFPFCLLEEFNAVAG